MNSDNNVKKYFVEQNPYLVREEPRLFVTAEDSRQRLGNRGAIERGEAMYRQSQANQPAITETNLGGSTALETTFNAQSPVVEPLVPNTPIESPETITTVLESQPATQPQVVMPEPVESPLIDALDKEPVSPILEATPIIDAPVLPEQPVVSAPITLENEIPVMDTSIFTEPVIAEDQKSANEFLDNPYSMRDDAGQTLDNPASFNEHLGKPQEQTIPTEIVEPVPAPSTDRMMINIAEADKLKKEIEESILNTKTLFEKYYQLVRRISEEAYEIEQQRQKDLRAINNTIDQAKSAIMSPEQPAQILEATPSIGL